MADEEPIIVRPGDWGSETGICLIIDDQNGRWTVKPAEEVGGPITITIPAGAQWKIERRNDATTGNKDKVLIFRAKANFSYLELKSLKPTTNGKYGPDSSTGQTPECHVVYEHS